MAKSESISESQKIEFLDVLKKRFEANMERHKDTLWEDVKAKLEKNKEKLEILYAMEQTGGEPDVVDFKNSSNQFVFVDCSKESPSGRRSLCYDKESWESRKKFKPEGSAEELAKQLGIEILNEVQYYKLQEFGEFDTKTSSWLKTTKDVRSLGGAIFGDYRYERVFIYHNGAESYYAARGFRGLLLI